jgi:signal transduction histidine kinase/CheY-like chemotaxis protein/HPt (histidine-containing phosphotransfer) domain-containing protein
MAERRTSPGPRPRGGLAAVFAFLTRWHATATPAAPPEPAPPASFAPSAPPPAPSTAPASRLHGEHASLQRRIDELTAQRDEARAQAQTRAEMLATMTHEIRTPMNGMMGMAHLLLETELDREQRPMLEVLLHAGESLLNLVNDTLDLARVESGRLELERLPFDLRVTINEAAALLAPLANEKALQFECVVTHEVPSRVWGDPGRLRQVLLNLGGNAIKFTAQGRVTVRVERLQEDDRTVRLRCSVTDTGIGMSEEQRGRIFQAFQQADASIARRYGGTGLGLSISSRLVSLMGGSVGVESTPEVGSTFWFDVEMEKQAEVPAGSAAAPSPCGLAGLRVLVVEPSAAMRRSYLTKLAAWGCRVEAAENGELALVMLQDAALASDPFRFALIERQLPAMDGEELGAAIRADDACDPTLTLLVTSAGGRGDAARARARGFSAYLSKPLEWEALAGVLAEVLQRAESAAPGTTPELVTLHSIAEARRSRLRILLVEDSAVNQLVTQWTLKRLGYGLEMTSTVSAALAAWEREPFDLVLLDLHLPDGDGYSLTEQLRARESPGRRVPIVAMTGSADSADRDRCLAAGMDEFLPKPVDLGLLCRVVEQLTDASASVPVNASPAAPVDGAGAPAKLEVVADDAPLLREIEAAEAEISGVARAGRGGPGREEAARPAGRPAGFVGTVAAAVLADELAAGERAAGGAVTAASAPALAARLPGGLEPAAEPLAAFRAVAAEAAAARVTGLVPTVDSLSSLDVIPLDQEPRPGTLGSEGPRPALDLERLEDTCMGVPALRETLLNTFLAEVRPRLEQLTQAVAARDAQRVEFEAHGLKGMCATLGAVACADLFAQIEHAGRAKTLDIAPPLLKRGMLEVTRTERFILTMERTAA